MEFTSQNKSATVNQSEGTDVLAHHGIKGQKWGRRRFQNEDGSLTAEGRKRYGVDEETFNGGKNAVDNIIKRTPGRKPSTSTKEKPAEPTKEKKAADKQSIISKIFGKQKEVVKGQTDVEKQKAKKTEIENKIDLDNAKTKAAVDKRIASGKAALETARSAKESNKIREKAEKATNKVAIKEKKAQIDSDKAANKEAVRTKRIANDAAVGANKDANQKRDQERRDANQKRDFELRAERRAERDANDLRDLRRKQERLEYKYKSKSMKREYEALKAQDKLERLRQKMEAEQLKGNVENAKRDREVDAKDFKEAIKEFKTDNDKIKDSITRNKNAKKWFKRAAVVVVPIVAGVAGGLLKRYKSRGAAAVTSVVPAP